MSEWSFESNKALIEERAAFLASKVDTEGEFLPQRVRESFELFPHHSIAEMIDHTVLASDAKVGQVAVLCGEALDNGFASVCVNPCHAGRAVSVLKGSSVLTCCVIGFPLGSMSTRGKVAEVEELVEMGVEEIDMVINVGLLKSGYFQAVHDDIQAIAAACHKGDTHLKVIIEATCLQSPRLIIDACLLSVAANADYVKTSTGMHKNGGAKADHVRLMRWCVGDRLGVKAAGGIGSYADAMAMVSAGASRIGASKGIKIVAEEAGAPMAVPATPVENPSSYYDGFDINNVVTLKYGTSKGCFFGCGAIEKFGDILDDLKPSCVGFVTSKGAYKRTGAWAVIQRIMGERNVPHLLFDKICTNPTGALVDECTEMFRSRFDENFVVCAIGGGSPIDAAKSVAVLLRYPAETSRSLYLQEFAASEAAPLVAVNLTAGTGTEVDRFAVVSLLKEDPPLKPILVSDSIYPCYSINDPFLLRTLPPRLTVLTAVDALNHVMEACTTSVRTPFSAALAQNCVQIVADWLPVAMKDGMNLQARYWLHMAAAMGGMAFDESLLHITHALEHTLSALIPDLAHGLGLAMIQPAVMGHIWPAVGNILATVFAPIIPGFKGVPSEAAKASGALKTWLHSVGVTDSLATHGFTQKDVARLVHCTRSCPGMDGLLSISPVPCGDDAMAAIFSGM
ncbi:deoxyribose-phosphate aldolase type I [Kipferlia bialata]|uniref:deoxyribose-phosphate aldolase n=1 Tax=Kipferlia bialata TaxID=797122 RepID=A0A9K3CYN5_9EUKA|nr:deoxyribose-phosphate aldolase type I [Kipferlia bialata]|eukprot:g7051.t1